MTIDVSPEVGAALAAGGPVVALESTLLCHGIPTPRNRELAAEIDDAVRAAGAVPATVAVIEGAIRVGVTAAQLERLLGAPEVAKCSTRDLPFIVAGGGLGATTVAATALVAARAGIRVMATGGLGGVHQGGELSLDVSADLEQLARSPLAVVCSGAKSILDLPRTVERLESLGVPVVGYRCGELPGFYSIDTGLPVPRIDEVAELCRLFRAHRELGLQSALVIAQPPPEGAEMDRAAVDALVAGAREAAQAAGIRGPAETPFMLRWMAEASGGATVQVNRALVRENAALAAQLACGLAGGVGLHPCS
jgi:pseudouridine-5'-phosphate glycosidase